MGVLNSLTNPQQTEIGEKLDESQRVIKNLSKEVIAPAPPPDSDMYCLSIPLSN